MCWLETAEKAERGAAERKSHWPQMRQKRSATELMIVKKIIISKDMCRLSRVAFSVCLKRGNEVVIRSNANGFKKGEELKDGAIDGDYRPTKTAGRPKIFLMFFNSPNIQ